MPAAQAGKAAKVTLVVDDVPVVQVLQTLAEQERQNLVVSPDVSGTLSLHLTDVPWKQALQTVVNSAGLVLRQEGNILHVHSQAWQKEHSARQDAERLRFQANLPLENRSISLQYADAGELAKAGEKLLSAKGTIMVDKRTNACCCAITARPWRSWKNGYRKWICRWRRWSWRRISLPLTKRVYGNWA